MTMLPIRTALLWIWGSTIVLSGGVVLALSLKQKWNSEVRTNFLSWGDNSNIGIFGGGSTSGSLFQTTQIGLDGVVTTLGYVSANTTTPNATWIDYPFNTTPTEGFHYYTIGGFVASGTGTWVGNSGLTGEILN